MEEVEALVYPYRNRALRLASLEVDSSEAAVLK